jgi:hypothetical protein
MAFLNAGKWAGGNGRMPWLAGLIAASALVFANGVLARDESCTGEIERDLHIEDYDSDFIVSLDTKPWPYKPDLMLTVIAYGDGKGDDPCDGPDPGICPGDVKKLIVAVIDQKSGCVVNSYQSQISEGAITEVGRDSLELDTARYQLAKDIRAFGVRFHNQGRPPSAVDILMNDELTLLIPEGKSLRPVLRRLPMHLNQKNVCPLDEGGWTWFWNSADLSIGIENTSTNGFHDLRVMASISNDTCESFAAGSDEPIDPIKEHVILRYDGERYRGSNRVVPWWLERWY